MRLEDLASRFESRYGGRPDLLAVAPGRVNLIGEHTDYNDGFVFPAAIDCYLHVAARRADVTALHSEQLGDGQGFDVGAVGPGEIVGWSAYVAGVAWALRSATKNPIPNIEALVQSDIPIGSGVSSSAAIEMAFGVLWNSLSGAEISNRDLAVLGQKCENQFVGINSGLMDQMASAMGKAGHAMFFDTRSLEITYARLPAELLIVLCDTKKPRSLTDSAYNERRSQCEEAARLLGVATLRDADLAQLSRSRGQLPDVVFRRARHVISENGRCCDFLEALQCGDNRTIGALMRESHESLRGDYEVSCPELDTMAEAAWRAP